MSILRKVAIIGLGGLVLAVCAVELVLGMAIASTLFFGAPGWGIANGLVAIALLLAIPYIIGRYWP